jgi:hypothetical protein
VPVPNFEGLAPLEEWLLPLAELLLLLAELLLLELPPVPPGNALNAAIPPCWCELVMDHWKPNGPAPSTNWYALTNVSPVSLLV